MKIRLRHKGRTVPIELDSDTALNVLKLQAQECFNIVSVMYFLAQSLLIQATTVVHCCTWETGCILVRLLPFVCLVVCTKCHLLRCRRNARN